MFVVIEIQKTDDTHVATLVSTHETRKAAESKYHTILSYAAVSELLMHSAMIMTDEAIPIKYESYNNILEPTLEEPEESEPETGE